MRVSVIAIKKFSSPNPALNRALNEILDGRYHLTINPEEIMEEKKQPKYMKLSEFIDGGYLQELNRRFLHPLGLALAVETDSGPDSTRLTVMIWDDREDSAGNIYHQSSIDNDDARRKRDKVADEFEEKDRHRSTKYGWFVQPIPEKAGGQK